MIARSLLVATLFALPLLSAGCRKAAVESYRIPKEKDAEMSMASAGSAADTNAGSPPTTPGAGNTMANTPVATADSGQALTWTAPAEWKAKTGSPMRKGSYAVPGNGGTDADLAITAFPGDVGGELANVNRWRGQVQLPPITEAELKIDRIEHNGLKFAIVDIVGGGATPTRILGAAVPFGEATWFIKMMGPDAVVVAAKPAFLAFLETVKPATPIAP